jgi:hypothetical protein
VRHAVTTDAGSGVAKVDLAAARAELKGQATRANR